MDKDAVKKEIAKLIANFEKNREDYDTTDEANIETKLIEPLFAALGWTKDDFEKREKVKRKDRRGITDYTYRLGGKSVFIVEAKKVKVDVDGNRETWKQAISYTFSKKVSFSVLTNFKDLLIFCTDDEMAMRPFRQMKYTEYLTSRFDDLLLLSRESFEQNLIFDRAASEGRMKKRRSIDDELLDDLIASRKKIAESIEQIYKGNYSTIEKDDIAQRIFGRLIFMRKCEDKQINFDKNNKEIELIRTVTELPHNEAYPALKKLFTKYNDTFDSGLFMKDFDSDVDKINLDGKVVKELIKHTYESSDGNYVYNFEWIDADVLGNVYEQYLGHILKETAKQTRIKESHAHRKEQGIYYTPTDIVKYIVENTLGELLKQKKPEEVRKLKVLDPACGSGSFLIKAFDVLEDYYEKNPIEKQKRLDSTGDFYTVKEQVLVNNIHGVDLDHKAVEIAQLNLLLKVAEKGHRLPLLQKNIQNGNSLIDDEAVAGDMAFKWEERFSEIMKKDGFDVIIGNPPYGYRGIPSPEIKEAYSKKYVTSEGNFDMYRFFIECSISHLKEDGILGFIIPNTFLSATSYKKMRKYILENCTIKKIVDLGLDVFEGVTIESTIIILQKNQKQNRKSSMIDVVICRSRSLSLDTPTAQYQIKQERFSNSEDQTFNIYLNPTANKIAEKMKENTYLLEKIAYVTVGINTGYIKDALVSPKKIDDRYHKLLSGRDINRYSLEWPGKWILYDKIVVDSFGDKGRTLPDRNVFDSEKILIQRTRRGMARKLVCTLDTDKFYNLNRLSNLVITNNDYSIKYCLGILNSTLMDFYFQKMFNEYEVKPAHLRQLPIKNLSRSDQEPIISLVDRMLSFNKKLVDFSDKNTSETARLKDEIAKIDNEIDELVYKIYNITEEERKIVEEAVK